MAKKEDWEFPVDMLRFDSPDGRIVISRKDPTQCWDISLDGLTTHRSGFTDLNNAWAEAERLQRMKDGVPVKTKQQRQAESRASQLDYPRRQELREAEEARYHAAQYRDVTEGLIRCGIDPQRLLEWIAGPHGRLK